LCQIVFSDSVELGLGTELATLHDLIFCEQNGIESVKLCSRCLAALIADDIGAYIQTLYAVDPQVERDLKFF